MRFPEFEGEWEETCLENICNKIGDGIHSTPEYNDFGDYFFVNGNNLVDGKIKISESTKRVSKKEAEKYNSNNLLKNTLFISINGTIGSLALYDNEPIMLGKSVCYINPKSLQNPKFIFYQLDSKRVYNYFISELTGTTIKNLSLKSIRNTILYIPLQEEQIKIARLLQLIDDRISTQNQIIEGLETLIKNLNNNLKELYGNEIEISLQQIGTFYSGLSGKSAEDFGRGKPFITYMNVYKNIIVDESMVQYVNIDKNESQNKVQYGDVLFTLSSETPQEVGMSAIYLGNNNELYLNSFCLGYRLNNFDTLLPEYMPYLFSCKQFRKIVSPLAQGSTRFNLQKTDFLNKKFKIPTIQNQKKISNILNALSEKLKIEQNLLSEYQNQKKYLLNQMFI